MAGPRGKPSNAPRAQRPKDEPIDPWAFQTCLEEILTGIQSAGFFAVSKKLDNAPNPGLCVEGLGSIGLPLSDRDAEALIAASHQTPFEKTWELPASVIHLKNPAWTELLNTVVQEVSRELGVDESGEKLKPSCISCFFPTKEECSSLIKRTCTPIICLVFRQLTWFAYSSKKVPGMFGTLLMALPL